MKIIELFSLPEPEKTFWFNKLKELDWIAAKSLSDYIEKGTFLDRSRGKASLFLLTQGDQIVSMCTLADEDDIACDYGPWIGYVYTEPQFRGHGIGLKLVETVSQLAREAGNESVYVSSGHKGLYEKAGFTPVKKEIAKKGYETTVFKKDLK